MSKTIEDKTKEILSGWGNWLFKTPEVEEIAKERAAICAACPSNGGTTCKECGCPLAMKTRSMRDTNECPLKKWKK